MPLWLGLVALELATRDLPAIAETSHPAPECLERGVRRSAPRAERRWTSLDSSQSAAYCALLSRGYVVLETEPKAALELARKAQSLEPKVGSALVLGARAALRLGQREEARVAFEKAKALGARAASNPGALREFALAARATGHLLEAFEALRELVSRAPLVSDRFARQRTLIEAALAAMALGSDKLAVATAYLEELRLDVVEPELRPFLFGALALAQSRAGQRDSERALAREAGGSGPLLRLLGEPGLSGLTVAHLDSGARKLRLPALLGSDLLGMLAVLSTVEDPAQSSALWSELAETATLDEKLRAHATEAARRVGGHR